MSKSHFKQTTASRYILKIPSELVRNSGWALELPLDEARKAGYIIALGESQVIRWRDDLLDDRYVLEQEIAIRREIKELKSSFGDSNSIAVRRKISTLYEELDRVKFIPEYLHLVIDKPADYRRACEGFTVNGISYSRLMGTTGGIKCSTIVFVSDTIRDDIRRRVDNNRDPTKTFVPAKFEAYRGLTCSATTPVSFPKGVAVIKDCFVKFVAPVINITDENEGEPSMLYCEAQEIEQDASDGYGLMLPSLATRWSDELKLDYVAGGFNTRFAWEKGMVFGFDFLDFADNVAGTRIIKDVWGNEVDLSNVELILTESMVKLWDSYKSADDYFNSSLVNGYTFGIPKVSPPKLETSHTLNYQFIQSYELDDDDIAELTGITTDEIKSLLTYDYNRILAYLRGEDVTANNYTRGFLDGGIVSALQIDPDIIYDPYVRSRIAGMLKNRITQAKRGILSVHGNYSILSGDPYSLCQSMFGLEVTGLLKAGEIYNKYWDDEGVEVLTAYRAPMTCHNNIRKVKPNRSEECRYWYKYMSPNTILNSWDTMTAALNGCDFDGDLVFLTDNPVLLRKHKDTPALMCMQRKAEKVMPTENILVESNIAAFGDEIGKITNRVTSMFEVASHFPEGSKEREVLEYRIKCGQHFQQCAIDKAKGIIAKPMPKEWYDVHAIRKSELLTDSEKEFYTRIVAEKKPYFMKYVYTNLAKDCNQYKKITDDTCRVKFNCTPDYLLVMENSGALSDEQLEYIRQYKLYIPAGVGGCVMNRICNHFEDEFDGYHKQAHPAIKFDYTTMKSNISYNKRVYYALKELYEDYLVVSHELMVNTKKYRYEDEDADAAYANLYDQYNRKAREICGNEKILCDIMLDLCYHNDQSKNFVWQVCGQQILLNMLEKNDGIVRYPVSTDDPNCDFTFRGTGFNIRYGYINTTNFPSQFEYTQEDEANSEIVEGEYVNNIQTQKDI